MGILPVSILAHTLAVEFHTLAVEVAESKGYDSIDIISHSWGTCVTYDVLQSGVHVRDWVTMGSPLRFDTPKPFGMSGDWIDIYSKTDPVTWLNCFPPFSSPIVGFSTFFGYTSLYSKGRWYADIPWQSPRIGHTEYWMNDEVADFIAQYLR